MTDSVTRLLAAALCGIGLTVATALPAAAQCAGHFAPTAEAPEDALETTAETTNEPVDEITDEAASAPVTTTSPYTVVLTSS